MTSTTRKKRGHKRQQAMVAEESVGEVMVDGGGSGDDAEKSLSSGMANGVAWEKTLAADELRKTAAAKATTASEEGAKDELLLRAVQLYSEAVAIGEKTVSSSTISTSSSSSSCSGSNFGPANGSSGGDFSNGNGSLDEASSMPTSTSLSVVASAEYGAAVCLRKLGRYEEAVVKFQRAVHLDPEGLVAGSRPGSLWENLGATFLRLKRFSEASEAYAAAVALEPGNAKLREGRNKALASVEKRKKKKKPQP
mmetsp:Transcript_19488/g.38607  ORF Transcript_19488/g.38607 Transcript_19488/m.38607 type:complete len:252 (+) Transcript_19488:279-1034(+)